MAVGRPEPDEECFDCVWLKPCVQRGNPRSDMERASNCFVYFCWMKRACPSSNGKWFPECKRSGGMCAGILECPYHEGANPRKSEPGDGL